MIAAWFFSFLFPLLLPSLGANSQVHEAKFGFSHAARKLNSDCLATWPLCHLARFQSGHFLDLKAPSSRFHQKPPSASSLRGLLAVRCSSATSQNFPFFYFISFHFCFCFFVFFLLWWFTNRLLINWLCPSSTSPPARLLFVSFHCFC